MRPIGFILPALALLVAASAGCDSGMAKTSLCEQSGKAASTRAADSGWTAPRLPGRIVDTANILSPAVEAELAERSAALERRTSDQFVIVTTRDLGQQPIEAFGLALGNAWGIGREDLDNGVLLILAPNDRRVRIEVGCGLEGLLTDEKAAGIIDAALIPLLRKGEYDAAARAGAGAIVQILESDTRRPQRRRPTGQP